MRKANGSIRAKRAVESVWSYSLLVVIAFVFLFPCVWLITSSFSSTGSIYDYVGFFPESFSFSTWIDLFTKKTPSCNYTVWLSNTFYVAILSSVFSTILVILTAYTMSRFRFKSRKLMMKMTLLFGIFPTFMNMTALFVIMTQLHLFNNLNGLISSCIRVALLSAILRRKAFSIRFRTVFTTRRVSTEPATFRCL